MNDNNDEVSLKEVISKIKAWFQYLLSKWVVIVIFGLLGGALGLGYSLIKKPIYVATTTFVLEESKGGNSLGSLAGLASMAGVDLGNAGGIFQGDNIIELYKSRNMLAKTLLSKMDENQNDLLIDRYISINHLREAWAGKPELAKLKFSEDTTNAAQILTKTRLQDSILNEAVTDINNNYLTVAKPDKKLSIIKVEVKAKDEFFAQALNNNLVKNVNEFYIRTKTKKSIENVNILQHKTDSVRAVMNGSIYSAVAVTDATPNLNPTRQIQRNAPAQKAQFSAETNKAVLSELLKNLEMSKISLLKETPLIQVVDEPIMPLFKQRVGKAQGIIMGGFLFGFLIVGFLSIKKLYKNL